ncbi:hypothetical protein NPX13_g4000 [Xylaria arbuscula]|uniref:RRM domain-containing protein n=1 Tax=Xylaria arbuscula TaxID=114810 RepID=A0A9W8NGV0_9PEZI|nr:hypothetical protein NPX13_g4000 [Xylaria arbuscula]
MPSELVYQHRQTPINGTISGMAPPGNETGYYYIPIANLPWQTSWQELKDHVRTVCSVEHVEINEDSTSGHVILKGRANFDAAFQLLNGGIFHDRALIADGRNVDSWVLIKQHVDGPNASVHPTALRHTAAPTSHTSLQVAPSSPGYVEWPAVSTSPSYMMSPVMDSPSYFVPCGMAEYTDSASIYGMSSCAVEHSHAAVSPVIPYPAIPSYTQQYAPSDYHGNGYPIHQNNKAHREGKKHADATPTKKRKIIIRQLQPWVSESQVRELIRHKAGIDSDRLTKLDMPLVDGQQANRGYVFATFVSEDAADKAIKRLNNCKYEDRVLEVKHSKENGSDHHQSSHASRSSHHRHSHHSHHHARRDRHDEKDKTSKDKEHSHKVTSSSEKKTAGDRKAKSTSSESDVAACSSAH